MLDLYFPKQIRILFVFFSFFLNLVASELNDNNDFERRNQCFKYNPALFSSLFEKCAKSSRSTFDQFSPGKTCNEVTQAFQLCQKIWKDHPPSSR